jgi:hypothetical protein
VRIMAALCHDDVTTPIPTHQDPRSPPPEGDSIALFAEPRSRRRSGSQLGRPIRRRLRERCGRPHRRRMGP